MNVRAALLVIVVAGCDRGLGPPRGQIVLHVTTDAPLPSPPGGSATSCPASQRADSLALFDTVQFDVIPAGKTTPCDRCSHQFPIDCVMVDRGAASIGVAPPPGERGWRVRVRIFHRIAVRDGAPIESAALDTTVALPPVAEDGIIDLTATLRTDAIGAPQGTLDAPAAASIGNPRRNFVGTWPSAIPAPCARTPGPEEACVPGGAFWMGNPTVGAMLASFDSDLPRLVVLSPFYIDTAEVTVGAFRAAGVARPWMDTADPGDPHDNDGSLGGLCTYSNKPVGPNDAGIEFPVNCLTWSKARQYCKAVGKDLPSEAEFEYVASGLRGTWFPWGEDEPQCGDAVFARGATPSIPSSCGPTKLTQPLVFGQGKLDRLALGDRVVTDLAGNLREWTRDVFAEQGEDCWNAPLLLDPECTTGKRGTLVHTVRGGSWRDQSGFLRAATRHFGWANGEPTATKPSPYFDDYGTDGATIGFRCARPGN